MIRLASVSVLLTFLVAGAIPLALAEDKPSEDKKEGTKFEMTKEEQKLLELTNKQRAKEKLPPLRANPVLFQVARRHSANMAKQSKLEHVLDGKNPAQRVLGAGYDYGKVAENIAMSDMPGAPLTAIMKGWMESKLHRDNLLNDRVSEIGLGIAKNDKGEQYYTQIFARPRKVIKQEKTP
jgi:uncharacterized protein YkwD